MRETQKTKNSIDGLFDIKQRFVDLNVIECGWEQCAPIKYVTAQKKNWYTLHIVESGKGTIEYEGKRVPLRTNDMFLVYPNQLVSYYPDPSAPWSYYWLCFEGLQADEMAGRTGMTPKRPYRQKNPHGDIMSYFAAAVEAFERKGKIVPECVGFLYVILGTLSDGSESMEVLSLQQRYVKEALLYIHFNFQFDISVADIAKNLRVSPNYLSNLFHEQMGMSTKQFIVKYRMEIAYKNLQRGNGRIKDVASSVGYADPLYFAKVFKKFYGKSPRDAWKDIQLRKTESEGDSAASALNIAKNQMI